MGLNLKMFDTLGMMTVVTPPSMLNPENLSFTIINLREKEKNPSNPTLDQTSRVVKNVSTPLSSYALINRRRGSR